MVFHFAGDGSGLTKVAQGFWNPFGLGLVGQNTLFAVDNDPDASPPCRLIHVVSTGDYGHRWEYGRAGVHPLQAWDGELPGTLPMVCGTGESPCAVVPHENHLWVTSWGDHRLERYQLNAKGQSFSAKRDVVVQGDADFRPTGCAVRARWFALLRRLGFAKLPGAWPRSHLATRPQVAVATNAVGSDSPSRSGGGRICNSRCCPITRPLRAAGGGRRKHRRRRGKVDVASRYAAGGAAMVSLAQFR